MALSAVVLSPRVFSHRTRLPRCDYGENKNLFLTFEILVITLGLSRLHSLIISDYLVPFPKNDIL